MKRPPAVIVTVVLLYYFDGALLVGLPRRSRSQDTSWHIAATELSNEELSHQAVHRYLYRNLGLDSKSITYQEQLYTFEQKGVHGNNVYISHIAISNNYTWHKGLDQIGIFPASKLPPLPSLDQEIIRYALSRVQAKAYYTNLPALLLPAPFSLADYQRVFETLAGFRMDRRNFYKKIKLLDIIHQERANDNASYVPCSPSLQLLEKPMLPVRHRADTKQKTTRARKH